jgi:hypothetical protein
VLINEPSDQDALQEDLDLIYEWTEPSLLKFHPDKCKVMTIGGKKRPPHTYTLGGHQLTRSEEEKDIDTKLNSRSRSIRRTASLAS